MRTQGIAAKVIAAVGAQVVALLVNLIASGEFDRVEFAQLVGVGLTAAFGYLAPPSKTA